MNPGVRFRGRVIQIRERFFLGGDDRDIVPHGSGRVQDQKRETAIPCDEA